MPYLAHIRPVKKAAQGLQAPLVSVPKRLKCTRGFSQLGIIITLLLLGIAVIVVLLIMNRTDKPLPAQFAKSTDAKVAPDSLPEHEAALTSQAENETESASDTEREINEEYSKAKKALAEGDYELAKELTYNAILQELQSVKDAV